MVNKSDFVASIQAQMPNIYNILGADKLDSWVSGDITSVTYDRWFTQYQAEGLSQKLRNTMSLYANQNSTGYSDYSNSKQIAGQQYRGYLSMAKQVLQASTDMLVNLQNQLAVCKDPVQIVLLNTQIAVQQATIQAQSNNVKTWQGTVDQALKAGTIV